MDERRKARLCATVIAAIAVISIFTVPARAGESYFYQGTSGIQASFYLIGGEYTLYVYAKRPAVGYITPASKSCIFSGNLQRLSPTHDTMSLGSGVTISTIVPHKIGPAPLSLAAGLYSLYIARLTDCDWHFNLESTNHNSAGVGPVQMLKATPAGRQFSETASVRDRVQFYAQYRTDHDTRAAVSGAVQIINAGKIVHTFPLLVGRDDTSKATAIYQDVQWEQSDRQYLGKNSVKFVVKIEGREFTSTGEFTLTQ